MVSIIRIKQLLKKLFLYKWYKSIQEKHRQERRDRLNEAFKREAEDVLRLYSDAMLGNNLVFWLDYGTLLGYYREHDFIKHDFDLDTSTWFENHERVKEVLEKNGFERVRYYYLEHQDGMEECYKHKDFDTTIDVFYYINDGEESYCYSFSPLVSMKKKRNLNKIQPSKARRWTFPRIHPIMSEFKGIKVYVPCDTASYLETTYGESFMIPIPNLPLKGRPNMTEFDYNDMPACAWLKVGYV